MVQALFFLISASLLLMGCGSSSSNATVKMRSALTAASAARLAMTANTTFNLESYKIPVQRISLVGELKGTGYSSTCSNLYRRGAGGVTTPLLTPVKSSDKFTVILYGDPKGAVYATTSQTEANSKCTGTDPASLCSDDVAVFGTVDSGTPKIERYLMTPSTSGYAKVLLTIAFDSSGNPFGAFMRHAFSNTSEERTLHGTANFSNVESNADGTLNFKYYASGTSLENVIANFTRGAHNNTILKLVNSATAIAVTKQ